ncbi:MAG: serine hydrolase family protein, partial [Rhizobiaceae bacterium]|nr:serine hydrolase family protein [Rhizobiaceae bacterium]
RSTAAPILLAHSLACQFVAHWAAGATVAIRGAFLVSPPDPSGSIYMTEAPSFVDPPRLRLPFPSLVIASTNDPFGSFDHAAECTRAWGSELIAAGALGHINADSGLGAWPEGRALFEAFCARLG